MGSYYESKETVNYSFILQNALFHAISMRNEAYKKVNDTAQFLQQAYIYLKAIESLFVLIDPVLKQRRRETESNEIREMLGKANQVFNCDTALLTVSIAKARGQTPPNIPNQCNDLVKNERVIGEATIEATDQILTKLLSIMFMSKLLMKTREVLVE